MKSKEAIRNEVRGKRKELPPEWIEAHSIAVQDRLMSLSEFSAAESVAMYLAFTAEVSTRRVLDCCWQRGRPTFVPAFDAQRSVYRLCRIDEGTPMAAGQWGIVEPRVPCWVQDDTRIDVLVVPGVAFDCGGARIGYGRGYYDRMAGNSCVQQAWKVGLAFDFQIFDCVPMEAHDVPMDAVVTESQVYKRQGA